MVGGRGSFADCGPRRAAFLPALGSGSLTQARRPQLHSSRFHAVFLLLLFLLMTALTAVPAPVRMATALNWLAIDSIEP